MSIKLLVLADKSVVVQNKVEMNLISHNSTCDIIIFKPSLSTQAMLKIMKVFLCKSFKLFSTM